MRQALPYSRRRQTVCILQSAGLLAAISPLFRQPQSAFIALLTLGMLAFSFTLDLFWLWRNRRSRRSAAGNPVVAK
jgi:hypothetical protein